MFQLFKVLNIIFSLAYAFSVFADDIDINIRSHQATTLPANARYEIIQSTLAAKWTFKLDRYTGRVWQLVITSAGENAWEEMIIRDDIKPQSPLKNRFQIFTSGLAARHTFLLDVETGKTWVVITGKRKADDGSEYEVNYWAPFTNQ